AVEERRRAFGEPPRNAGRSGEAGEPGEPLLRGRHVFVLMTIGTRHDEPGEAAPREFGTQRRHAWRARIGCARIVERLELGLEHWRNLWGGARGGNGL